MMLQADSSTSSMPLVVSGLLAFIGALLVLMLQRVLKQGDGFKDDLKAFGVEQTRQGTSITRIETTLDGPSGLVTRVAVLHADKNREHARRLEEEVMENAELRSQLAELRREKL